MRRAGWPATPTARSQPVSDSSPLSKNTPGPARSVEGFCSHIQYDRPKQHARPLPSGGRAEWPSLPAQHQQGRRGSPRRPSLGPARCWLRRGLAGEGRPLPQSSLLWRRSMLWRHNACRLIAAAAAAYLNRMVRGATVLCPRCPSSLELMRKSPAQIRTGSAGPVSIRQLACVVAPCPHTPKGPSFCWLTARALAPDGSLARIEGSTKRREPHAVSFQESTVAPQARFGWKLERRQS
eukprot:scaffold1665_cov67-Phaeocystis_antarctica.AAC.3